jgi:hypothetical protein
MKHRGHTFQETQSLREAMRDFLVAWLELVRLFELMSHSGFTRKQQSEILETALNAAAKELPADDRQKAAERVKRLVAGEV